MSTTFDLDEATVTFIRNALRQASVKWPGRSECLKRARKKVFVRRSKAGREIFKYYWQCAHCKQWFRNVKLMEVDHIFEIGPFKGDWNEYLFRHFPRVEFLQALCQPCHLKKTKKYNSARTRWKRK